MFRWDAAANLVSSDHPGGYVEHNRLKMFEDKRFEYDAYGRLVRKLSGHGPAKELTLEYDDWNQLKTVVTKDRLGIATTHFEYDAFGRRIRKLNGSYASTDFLWDGMRLVQETYHDRQGEEALTYLYESNSYVPLARIDRGKAAANDADVRDAVYYFHNDVSGLPEELTDAGGELVWQARYKVWGNAVQEEWVARVPQRAIPAWGQVQEAALPSAQVPRPQNLRFQRQYLDRETGLHYNTFWFYDPDIGRFINPDPIGLLGGTNFYRYAPNPIQWIDPWGWAYQGVDFSGSPDLFPVTEGQRNIVEITMQGSRSRDFVQAFKEANISKADATGYTWHHLNDFNPETGRTTMQLVQTQAHIDTFPHAGSADQFAKHFGVAYDSPEAVRVAQEQGWLKGRSPKRGC
ncbi:RHS repeat-associated core domain-containing protein [Burkholderia ambifaria]|uniref:RHS repeat-associated core domain-containing protein n=1 Tax=Burkholderia ambifaria TaxID=152480 RepID=UPI001FC81949|nr:RHS repeat-associated core domain-containing protein [Burkholderia ambifaria]